MNTEEQANTAIIALHGGTLLTVGQIAELLNLQERYVVKIIDGHFIHRCRRAHASSEAPIIHLGVC